ncbi:sensor histidine kinase [Salana multivorans]
MQHSDRPVLRSRAWPAACGVLATLYVLLGLVGVDQPPAAILTVTGALGIAAVIVVVAALRTRARRRAYELELTAWASERAVQAERLRIARELHDLASHGLGLITLRASAARSVAGPDVQAEHAAALADIEQAGRRATQELRRMLTVLREPDATDVPLHPAEGLADLPDIVAAARAAGVDAVLDVELPTPPSGGVQLAVCAVVREGLANVARHAGTVPARVTVRREGNDVVVVIENDPPRLGWQPVPGAGHGLIGLRERVSAMAGTLDAGMLKAEPHGQGFRLQARLPEPEAP